MESKLVGKTFIFSFFTSFFTSILIPKQDSVKKPKSFPTETTHLQGEKYFLGNFLFCSN